MKILFINMLEERHASTRRARMIVHFLRDINEDVTYLESNLKSENENDVSIKQINNIIGYMWSTITRIILCFKFDYDSLYFQKMLPFYIPCMVVAKLRKKKVFIDIDDIDTEYQPNNIRKVFHSMSDSIILKLVDLITTHNSLLKEEIHRKGGKHIVYLNQGIDLNVFKKTLPEEALVEKLNIQNKTIFLFLGSFSTGSCAELPIIINAFSNARNKRDDIFLLLIMGGGPWKEKIVKLINKLGLSNSTKIVGYIPLDELSKYLSLGHCGLIYMESNKGNATRFSMKVLEYLAMGMPVLGKLYGATLMHLGKYCSLVNDPAELSGSIECFYSRNNSTQDAWQYLKENHDNSVLRNQLKHILERV